MIKPAMLDAYSEDDVKQVWELTDEVLKRIDDERKVNAIEQARVMFAAAGLTFKDLGKAKGKTVKGTQYKEGHSSEYIGPGIPSVTDCLS